MADDIAVVFDLGNVFLPWDPKGYYTAHFGIERTEAFFAAVPILEANAAVDAGAPYPKTIEDLASTYPQWQAQIAFWTEHWLKMISPVNTDVLAIFDALRRQGTPCYALTNFGADTFALAAQAYPFLTQFDRRFVSGELRMCKPDAEIYATVERETGRAPAQLFFTDDIEANILTARDRGWHVLRFASSDALAETLIGLNILQRDWR